MPRLTLPPAYVSAAIMPEPATAASVIALRCRSPLHLGLLGLLMVLSLTGCGGLEPVATHEAETDPIRLYMALRLNYRAINLATTAPYHTIQLTATPYDGRDSVMSDLPAPKFRLLQPADTMVLRVDSVTGQLTALAAASRIGVIAELVTPGPVRRADTALVNITADLPPVLDSLSIEPAAPEAALWPLSGAAGFDFLVALIPEFERVPELTAQALDPAGQPIANLVVEYASLDPEHATVGTSDENDYRSPRFNGRVEPLRPGPARAIARTWAYGVAKVDTALYTVTWQRGAVLSTTPDNETKGFFPDAIWIVPNGVVLWLNPLGEPIDVAFDDPSAVADPGPIPWCINFPESCGAGDLLLTAFDPNDPFTIILGAKLRRFPTAGVYTYHSPSSGLTGRIIVTNELDMDTGSP